MGLICDFRSMTPWYEKKEARRIYQKTTRDIMNTIKVFCLDTCEHSNHLKQELWDNNIAFEEVYLGSTRAIHDLRNGGLLHARAPVLQVKERFYTGKDLFPGGIMDSVFIERCLLETDSLSEQVESNG